MNYDYCNGSVYVIKQGDTLYHISRKYNVPLALILRANPYVDVYNLQVGDELCIPDEQNMFPEASPGPGPMPLPTPGLPGNTNGPEASPGPGPMPLPTPGLPGNTNGPEASPGPGPMPLPTPGLPGNTNGPEASPGPGPVPLPTPGLPGDMWNPNVNPGPGPMPLPTPGLPGNMWNPNVNPGPGPVPLPTPGLPENNSNIGGPGPVIPPYDYNNGRPCCQQYQLIAYVVKENDNLQRLLQYFGITLADLLKFNDLDGIMLKPGMTIRIPKKTDD